MLITELLLLGSKTALQSQLHNIHSSWTLQTVFIPTSWFLVGCGKPVEEAGTISFPFTAATPAVVVYLKSDSRFKQNQLGPISSFFSHTPRISLTFHLPEAPVENGERPLLWGSVSAQGTFVRPQRPSSTQSSPRGLVPCYSSPSRGPSPSPCSCTGVMMFRGVNVCVLSQWFFYGFFQSSLIYQFPIFKSLC